MPEVQTGKKMRIIIMESIHMAANEGGTAQRVAYFYFEVASPYLWRIIPIIIIIVIFIHTFRSNRRYLYVARLPPPSPPLSFSAACNSALMRTIPRSGVV